MLFLHFYAQCQTLESQVLAGRLSRMECQLGNLSSNNLGLEWRVHMKIRLAILDAFRGLVALWMIGLSGCATFPSKITEDDSLIVI
jgi:hypothetical protein